MKTIANPSARTSRRSGAKLLYWLARAREVRRQRRALAALDRHLLKDIGLTTRQARAEARKPFWR